MQKIPTIFQRNPGKMAEVLNVETPNCTWVFAGEGTPTIKMDGTCCMVRDGTFYKRYELRPGKQPPPGFEAADIQDTVTGKQPGWVMVGLGPEDRWHREAWEAEKELAPRGYPVNGTYELLGPKIQGNPEGYSRHEMVNHLNAQSLPAHLLTYEGIKIFLGQYNIEGIVYHHSDGRMAKIKQRDFGLERRAGAPRRGGRKGQMHPFEYRQLCQACTEGRHEQCGMQTWCACDDPRDGDTGYALPFDDEREG